MSTPTLEQKIATALTATDITSTELSQLIVETEAAAAAAGHPLYSADTAE
jgi:hypothetical protein